MATSQHAILTLLVRTTDDKPLADMNTLITLDQFADADAVVEQLLRPFAHNIADQLAKEPTSGKR